MQSIPPTGTTPLAKREAQLAWSMLLPTIMSVALVVVLPLLAIFWISVKTVSLADLRPPTPIVREDVRGEGQDLSIRYRIRNYSPEKAISNVHMSDINPSSITIKGTLPEICRL